MAKHARLSPSSAEKWVNCPAAPFLEKDVKEEASDYASTGTAAHWLAAEGLTTYDGKLPTDLIGQTIVVHNNGDCYLLPPHINPAALDHFLCEVTEDMWGKVQTYIDVILKNQRETGGQLFVESKINIEPITGELGAEGSADAVILSPTGLQVHDLKYGHKPVTLEGNKQLAIYALGMYEDVKDFYPIETIRLGIHMPNLYSFETIDLTVQQLLDWGESLQTAAKVSLDILEGRVAVDEDKHIRAGDHCRKGYCKVRATCKKLHDLVVEECDFEALPATAEELNSITPERMGYVLTKKKLIEDWLGAIEKRANTLAANGTIIPHHKLVKGPEGNREWDDKKAVEEKLKGMKGVKIADIYDTKLISPTTADKLAKKKVIGPKQWQILQEHITRRPGNNRLVPDTDKGEPVIVDLVSDFESII